MALTPDSQRTVTAGEDFTARVWDMLTGRCTGVLTGHSGWVVDVVITPDGSRAISASHDGTARWAPSLRFLNFGYLSLLQSDYLVPQ